MCVSGDYRPRKKNQNGKSETRYFCIAVAVGEMELIARLNPFDRTDRYAKLVSFFYYLKGQEMSREIKFRAWHKKTKFMYWFDVMWGSAWPGGGWIGMLPIGVERKWLGMRSNVELVDPDGCEIMQFTGLQDKNGVEIFEGDIIANVKYPYIGNHLVRWANKEEYCGFVAAKKNQIVGEMFLTRNFDNCEVIGNIHENPELIGGTK